MIKTNVFKIKDIKIGGCEPFVFISGPCQIENRDHSMRMAEKIGRIANRLGIPFIFKSSYDKANRTSLDSKRGVGIDSGLKILTEIRDEFGCPVLTDVHTVDEAKVVGEIVDVIQIPALLCRQTDLLVAAGCASAAVNIKKGQFLAPWNMKSVSDKVVSQGNKRVLLCERGTSFGYNSLVSDFRSLPIMADIGFPIVFDATHSVQEPGGLGTSSGGAREFVPILAKAALINGISAIFAEVHDNPDQAPSDGPSMLPLSWLENLLVELKEIDWLVKKKYIMPK